MDAPHALARAVPNITDLCDAGALAPLRMPVAACGEDAGDKAALLPFWWDAAGQLRYVVYAPVARREAVPESQLPYQLARGTRRCAYQQAEERFWRDKGRGPAPGQARLLYEETWPETACREGEEELGLPRAVILELYDCGRLRYVSPQGHVYGLHTFLARIAGPGVLTAPAPHSCAARLADVTLAQACATAKEPAGRASGRGFKPSYVPFLQALESTICARVRA